MIAIGVTAVAVILLTTALWQNRNTLAAAYRFARYSKEDLHGQMAENQSALAASIQEAGLSGDIRDFTEEEESMLRDGTLTPEEAVERLFQAEPSESEISSETSLEDVPPSETDDTTAATSVPETADSVLSETTAQTEGPPDTDTLVGTEAVLPSDDVLLKEMQKYVKKLYTAKAEFTARLGKMENGAIADYTALPKEEQNLYGKQKVVMQYWNEIVEMEKECDALVDEVVVELEKFLSENNMDTALCPLIRKYYAEEKEIKKAYYMKRLMD